MVKQPTTKSRLWTIMPTPTSLHYGTRIEMPWRGAVVGIRNMQQQAELCPVSQKWQSDHAVTAPIAVPFVWLFKTEREAWQEYARHMIMRRRILTANLAHARLRIEQLGKRKR